MRDSSSDDLLNEINGLCKLHDFWPAVAITSGLIVIALFLFGSPLWLMVIAILTAAIATKKMWDRDVTKRSVALLYDLEPPVKDAYSRVHNAFDALRQAGGVWHIEAQGSVKMCATKQELLTLYKGNASHLKSACLHSYEAILMRLF